MDGIKIFLAILPVFIFALYVYIHDNEKEPTNMLIKAFVFGMLIAIPCIYVESALSSAFYFLQKSYITSLLYVFLVIALVEEGYKFLATYILFYHDKNVNYTFDMIVYTTFLGLGFAFFENIIYLRSLPIASVILRGFTAVPVHLSCGIIMGYYSSLMKTDKKNFKTNLLKALLIPISIHAFYNYYLVYISSLIRKLFTHNQAIMIIYSLLILLLGCLFLTVHYILSKCSLEDKKIKVKK